MKAIIITYAGTEANQATIRNLVKVLTEHGIVDSNNINTIDLITMNDADIAKAILAKSTNILVESATTKPKSPYEFILEEFPIMRTHVSFESMLKTCDKLKHAIEESGKAGDTRIKDAVQHIIDKGLTKAVSNGFTNSGFYTLKIINSF